MLASCLVCLPPGSSPGRHIVVEVFLGVPLSSVYKWVPTNLMSRGNPVMDKHPIQWEGGGGGRNTPTCSRFMLLKL